MDRAYLIAQLAVLKKKYVDKGESMDQLIAHFQAAMDYQEIVMIQENGQIVAFADWSWIDKPEDVEKVNRGEHTTGRMLHIINLVCTKPSLIWRIKQALPEHLWISGERDGILHYPRGLPQLAEV